MHKNAILFLLLFLIPLAGSTHLKAVAANSPHIIEEYKLHPMESIKITIYGEDELSREVTIRPDGKISLPLIQEIQIAGLTIPQLENLLAKQYNKFIKNPLINVEVTKFHHPSIRIVGEVTSPRLMELEPSDTVLDALMRSGGATSQGDITKVAIIRNGSIYRNINTEQLLWGKNLQENITLEDGDQILVPKRDKTIIVMGKIAKPGSYDYISGESVLEAILRAGGITEDADRKTAKIFRKVGDEKEITVPLNQLLQGNITNNVSLQPGDMIVIPETNAKVIVLGEVSHIGLYALKEGETILDILTKAGGMTEKANRGKIAVLRRQDDTPQMIYVSLNKVSPNNDKTNLTLQLQAGDIVFVPTAKKPFKLTDIITSLLFFTKSVTVK